MSATSEASPGELLRSLIGRQADNFLLVLVTLWAGALWTVGFIVAPTLFDMLSERALAGSIAGRLFQTVNWIGLAVGGYVLLHAVVRDGAAALYARRVWLVVAMLSLVLVSAFGIQPLIAELRTEMLADPELRARFATWHGVSSALYVLQSALALMLVVSVGRKSN